MFVLSIRGVDFTYCGMTRELSHGGKSEPIPTPTDIVNFRVLGDRTSLEVFVSGGLVYWPLAVVADQTDNAVRLTAAQRTTQVEAGQLFEIASSWI